MTPKKRETQLEIDWHRGRQLHTLADAQLPRVRTKDKKAVSPATMKAVLRTIDDHGRGSTAFLTHATIARQANISLRVAKRATEALNALGLLCVERRVPPRGRKPVNHYTIVWSQLALLCLDQSATLNDQSATVAPRTAQGNAIRKRSPLPPSPKSPSPAETEGGEGACQGDWRDVFQRLQAADVKAAQLAVDHARRQRMTPDEVLAMIEHYQAGLSSGRYRSPAVLYRRITTGTWPPPPPGWIDPAQRRTEHARTRERHQAQAKEGELERRRIERLEQLHGSTLDSLPPDLLAALVQQLPAWLQEQYHRNPAGLARPELLEAIANARPVQTSH